MTDYAARDYSYWDRGEGDLGVDAFGFTEDVKPSVRKPIGIYSKRASLLNEIRTHSKWAHAHAGEDLIAPTPAAQAAAATLINEMPEGCLGFRLAITHSGEINFFFGQPVRFQMLIDEDGHLSYYGKFEGERFAASDTRPETFPYMKLLRLLAIL